MKEAAIGIVIAIKDHKILLVKRRDVPIWVIPGGGIEKGESPENAVVREVQEETGLQIKIVRKVAEYTPTNRLASPTHFFECEAIGGQLTTGKETCNVGFYAPDHFPSPFFPIHKEWINDVLENRSFIIKRSLNTMTYRRSLLYLLRHPIIGIRYLLARVGLPLHTH